MSFCSDIVNLQSLFTGDRGAGPKAALAVVSSKLKVAEARLERLMEALLDDAETPPASFMKRARELEAERDKLTEDQKAAERALAEALRADTAGADSRWQSLREGVHALDKEARLQARQLVADTFERILVFHKGTVPNECTKGMIEVMLMAKGGHPACCASIFRVFGPLAKILRARIDQTIECELAGRNHASIADHDLRPSEIPSERNISPR